MWAVRAISITIPTANHPSHILSTRIYLAQPGVSFPRGLVVVRTHGRLLLGSIRRCTTAVVERTSPQPRHACMVHQTHRYYGYSNHPGRSGTLFPKTSAVDFFFSHFGVGLRPYSLHHHGSRHTSNRLETLKRESSPVGAMPLADRWKLVFSDCSSVLQRSTMRSV